MIQKISGTTEFGDSAELSADLIALVRAGKKTATTSALRDWEAECEPLPEPGQRYLVLDWSKRPALVIEITEVRVMRFDQVDEAFALDEGEDEDLEGWRAGHARYFERNGGVSPDLMVVCERFRLVEDLAERKDKQA